MRNTRELLLLTDGVRRSLAALRTRAEMLPEGNDVRESILTHLEAVEPRVDEEIAALRRTIEEAQRR